MVAPVALTCEIDKDKERFRFVGRIRTTLELSCGRCLEPFRLPVDSPFDLRYLPHAGTRRGEVAIEEDDLATAFYQDDEIDLGQMMREQLYLALPMKPLCRDDVPGTLPGLRREPERDDLCAASGPGRTPGWRACKRSAEEGRRCLIPNDDTRRRARPSAARTTRSSRWRLGSARSATSRSRRTRCARTAATTAAARRAR